MTTAQIIAFPTDAVSFKEGRAITTSLKVAEVFQRRHREILRAIRELDCSPEFNGRNFASVEYLDRKGERRPMYEIQKDGLVFLVMGLHGAEAARRKEAYIAAFNAMEAEVRALIEAPPPPEKDAWVTIRKEYYIDLLELGVDKLQERAVRGEYKRRASPAEYRLVARLARLGMTPMQMARALPMPLERIKAVLREIPKEVKPEFTMPLIEGALAPAQKSAKA